MKFTRLVTDASRLGFTARDALRGAVGVMDEVSHDPSNGRFASGGGSGGRKSSAGPAGPRNGGASAHEHKTLMKAGYTHKVEPGTHTYTHPTGGPNGGPSTIRYQTRH